MSRLEKLGVFPSRCLNLKDNVPLYAPCISGTERRRKCITKRNKSRYASKGTTNNPGAEF